MRTPEDWKKALEQSDLGMFTPLLLQHWQPCLLLKLEAAGNIDLLTNEVWDETAIGSSKVGGYPDLPADFAWPVIEFTDTDDTAALPFLAQINLGEIAGVDEEKVLPAQGLLLFFFDFTFNYDAWQVLYFPPESGQLVRANPPANLLCFGSEEEFPGIESPLRPHFERSSSLPAIYGSEFEEPFERIAQENGVTKQNDIYALMDKYERLCSEATNQTGHQLLGFDILGFGRATAAEWWQGQEGVAGSEAQEWRLLFQLGQEFESGLSIGCGAGVIMFFIRADDLKNANFDNVYASYLK